jgi:hypothetical protein
MAVAQDLRDTINIVSDTTNPTIGNAYHFKGDDHFNRTVKFQYPSDPYGKYSLASDANAKIDSAIHHVFKKGNLERLKGKRINFSIDILGNGHINRITLHIKEADLPLNDLSKREVYQLIQIMEKEVMFEVVEEARSWPYCSFVFAHRVK